MKQLIVSIAATLVIGVSSVQANNIPDSKVEKSFRKEFPGASLEQWGKQDGYFSVTFLLNNTRTMAFFDQNGEFQGSVNTLFFDQLPLAVRTSFAKNFSQAVILECYEITNPENTRYKLVTETNGRKHTAFIYYDGTIINGQKG